MKLGIALLVLGVALLVVVIPFSIWGIVAGVAQLEASNISGGALAYLGVAGVIAGFALTVIGATRVFRR